MWVTNGPIADVITTFAVTEQGKGHGGITAFVVDTEQEGVRIGKIDEKMGLHGSLTSEIIFDGAFVPAENVIGEEGKGFRTAMKTLDAARIALGASCVGQAQAMLDRAVAWAEAATAVRRAIGDQSSHPMDARRLRGRHPRRPHDGLQRRLEDRLRHSEPPTRPPSSRSTAARWPTESRTAASRFTAAWATCESWTSSGSTAMRAF